MMKNIVILVIAALFCGAAVHARDKVDKGDIAPNFTLNDPAGATFELNKFRGKRGIVLIFSYSECPKCLTEIPEISALADIARRNKVIVAMVNSVDNSNAAVNMMNRYNINYHTLLDLRQIVQTNYGITHTPTLIAIDGTGRVVYRNMAGIGTSALGIPASTLIKMLQNGIR